MATIINSTDGIEVTDNGGSLSLDITEILDLTNTVDTSGGDFFMLM